jgi:hypothetical protein
MNLEQELNTLCDKYGSDKGSRTNTIKYDTYNFLPHSYTKIYAELFADLKDLNINIFECGIGTNNTNIKSNMGINGKPGASLRVWKDFFKNAIIYGADIDSDILFEEDRIKTGYLDQLNPSTIDLFFNKLNNFTPHIIIDDGLHTDSAAISLYDNCFQRLASGGLYIIEDMNPIDISKVVKHISNKEHKFVVYDSIDGSDKIDNSLIVIWKDSNEIISK